MELTGIANYCVKELGLDEYDIEIVITECCLKNEGAMGFCHDVIEGEIDIQIDQNMSLKKKMITLCHEMVHARQACRGDEAFCEIEACKLESVLYNGFIQEMEDA
jgi:hypothetical protein